MLYVLKYTEDTTAMRELLSKLKTELRRVGVELVVAVTHLGECKYPVTTCMATITKKLGLGYDETVPLDATPIVPKDIEGLPTFDTTKDVSTRDTIRDVVGVTEVYLEPDRLLKLVRRLRLGAKRYYEFVYNHASKETED